MKKRVLLVIMGISIMAFAAGCSKKGVADDLDTNTDATISAAPTEGATDAAAVKLPEIEDYKAGDYITLGKYKGVEVTVEQLEVTEEDINTAITDDLKANALEEEITGRPVQEGDTVNIDFEGLLNGEAFEGGTAQGYDLVIGSGSFIEGFEEGIIGANVGDKLALDVTFPENYQSADLAGKPVVFNVTVNAIKQSVTPELTEDYVTANTDYKNIDEYKTGIRTRLETENQSTMDNEKANNVMQAVLDNSTIKSLPETLSNYYTALLNYQVENEASYYGMEKDAYIEYVGMTQEKFEEYITTQVKFYGEFDLMLKAVAEAEKLEVADEEYKTAVSEYMTNYGVATEAELYEQVSEAQIKYSLLMQKAYDFIMDNSVLTNK